MEMDLFETFMGLIRKGGNNGGQINLQQAIGDDMKPINKAAITITTTSGEIWGVAFDLVDSRPQELKS